MFELHTLGSVGLRSRDIGDSVAEIVQPKRLALLIYLTLAPRRRFRRRDQLVAFFWPDLDSEHARGSLSQALRHLRRVIGEIVITQGEDEVGIDQAVFWCDANALASACEAGDLSAAVQLYKGLFLEGFHVTEVAPEFESWVDQERDRLRKLAATAARRLAKDAETRGDIATALQWAQRTVAILPDDETAVARLIHLLDLSGDRMGALRAYEGLWDRLMKEFQTRPSAETEAIITRIRSR